MDAFQSGGAERHPTQVAIPHARTEGVRAYREPEQPHPLQLQFLEAEGERAWIEGMRALLAAGQPDEANRRLAADLAGFDGALAQLCHATQPEQVTIDGWEDLLPILAEWEGPPVTAITLGLTNPPDLVFEPGQAHEPDLLLGLYSDEAYPFSTASTEALLAECKSEDPAWTGREEDVEFYCALSGLAELNTALIHHKHRYFLRDGRDGVQGRAPGGYVEYVLACWLRSIRFLQAVQRVASDQGLPDGVQLIAGAVEVNADFVTLVEPGQRAALERASAPAPVATLTMKPWVPREEEPPAVTEQPQGSVIRRRLASEPVVESASPPEQRTGFLARLLGRLRRG